MSRNVSILIIVLVIILMAVSLLMLRNKFKATENVLPITQAPQVVTKTPTLTPVASPSAVATPSGKISVAPSKSSTSSSRLGR